MGTSVEWRAMISMNHYSHSHTETLPQITKHQHKAAERRTDGEKERGRNNREEMVKK